MKKIPFYYLLIFRRVLVFACLCSFFSCESNNSQKSTLNSVPEKTNIEHPENFELVNKSFKFKSVDFGYAKCADLEGVITFRNTTSYGFSGLKPKYARLEYTYADNSSSSFDLLLINASKKWDAKSLNKFSFVLNPINDYPKISAFSRTPIKAIFSYSVVEINIDKELLLEGEIDLLSTWKSFQADIGLRR